LFVGFWGRRGQREKIKEIEPQIALIYTEKQPPSKSGQKRGSKSQERKSKIFYRIFDFSGYQDIRLSGCRIPGYLGIRKLGIEKVWNVTTDYADLRGFLTRIR